MWVLILPYRMKTSLKSDKSIPVTLNLFPGVDFPGIPRDSINGNCFLEK